MQRLGDASSLLGSKKKTLKTEQLLIKMQLMSASTMTAYHCIFKLKYSRDMNI